ncbi:MAG TPA: sigma-70 family RNA polymerase sigma factor [Thermoanaerobaculia bacterium]|jgi:RNA polymerase sigma factor (sigma-70 family)
MTADAPPTTRQIAESVLLDENQRRKLFAYASTRFAISTQDAEDLLQDTALELLRCRSYVRSPDAFVFAVFRARCARFTGGQVTARTVFIDGHPRSERTGGSGATERTDSSIALREALSEVSTACRRLLSAYYVEGRSLREAARTVSLAYSGIAKTINRCLKRLRRCLG